MRKRPARKRPCRICRRWFLPNPRLKDRQMTCGDSECQKQWHRRKCAQWNRANVDYFRSNYLQKKLDAATEPGGASKPFEPISKRVGQRPKSRLRSGLPLEYVQEVIGLEHLIIIEYLAQHLVRRFQEVFKRQVFVNTSKIDQLLLRASSRGDGL